MKKTSAVLLISILTAISTTSMAQVGANVVRPVPGSSITNARSVDIMVRPVQQADLCPAGQTFSGGICRSFAPQNSVGSGQASWTSNFLGQTKCVYNSCAVINMDGTVTMKKYTFGLQLYRSAPMPVYEGLQQVMDTPGQNSAVVAICRPGGVSEYNEALSPPSFTWETLYQQAYPIVTNSQRLTGAAPTSWTFSDQCS